MIFTIGCFKIENIAIRFPRGIGYERGDVELIFVYPETRYEIIVDSKDYKVSTVNGKN